jgi:hypothetical protein
LKEEQVRCDVAGDPEEPFLRPFLRLFLILFLRPILELFLFLQWVECWEVILVDAAAVGLLLPLVLLLPVVIEQQCAAQL